MRESPGWLADVFPLAATGEIENSRDQGRDSS